MEIENTWIETTTFREDNRTLWLVRHRGAILKVGELRDDPSGVRAYEQAAGWAKEHAPGIELNWKHQVGARSEY